MNTPRYYFLLGEVGWWRGEPGSQGSFGWLFLLGFLKQASLPHSVAWLNEGPCWINNLTYTQYEHSEPVKGTLLLGEGENQWRVMAEESILLWMNFIVSDPFGIRKGRLEINQGYQLNNTTESIQVQHLECKLVIIQETARKLPVTWPDRRHR